MPDRPPTPEDEAAFRGMGKVIAEIRERRGIEPEAFAAMIKEDARGLERLERGEADARWGTLRLIARALRLPLDRLVELAEEEAPGEGGAKWRLWSREAEATWTTSEPWAGPGAQGRGVFYPDLLGELLDVQLFMEAHGGFPAVEAEAAGEGAVRTGTRLLAFLSRASVEGLGAQSARFDPLPHLCFGFEAEEEAPEGFAVEIEALLRALKACRAPERPQPPAAACEVRHPDDGALRAGEPRLLRLSVVDLQRPSLGEAGPQLGVGFEVCDEHDHPLYRFAMEGLAPFLAIGVPVLGEPPRRRLSFAEELDALSRDGRLPGEEDKGHNSPRSPGR